MPGADPNAGLLQRLLAVGGARRVPNPNIGPPALGQGESVATALQGTSGMAQIDPAIFGARAAFSASPQGPGAGFGPDVSGPSPLVQYIAALLARRRQMPQSPNPGGDLAAAWEDPAMQALLGGGGPAGGAGGGGGY